MSRVELAPVLENRQLSGNSALLVLQAPGIARRCLPGQFVMASEEDGMDQPFPLLKRALAVYSTHFEGQENAVSLLFKVVGDGTRRLASLRSGDQVSLVGPLGNGFSLQEGRTRVCYLVAGGIGIASFYLLAEGLLKQGDRPLLVYGARSQHDLAGIEDFEALGMPVYVATQDGSRGMRGLVTLALQEAVSDHPGQPAIIYSCGPTPMMQAVSLWAQARDLPCRISVENRMACGFGVCLGCTVQTTQGYRLACSHGPVFDAAQFVWESQQSPRSKVWNPVLNSGA